MGAAGLPTPISLILTAMAVAGVLFIRAALRLRRRGDTPHCRHCGYILLGLDLDLQGGRCPECGRHLAGGIFRASAPVVRGDPYRRLRLLWLGLPLLLPGLILGILSIVISSRRIDPYQYRPTGWVIRDLRSATDFGRAWAELARRLSAGKLSPQQRNQMEGAILSDGPECAADRLYAAELYFLPSCRDGTLPPQKRHSLVLWAIRQAQSPERQAALTAWSLLQMLRDAGAVDDSEYAALIEVAIDESIKPAPGPLLEDASDWISRLGMEGSLSAEQTRRFLQGSVSLLLKTPPVVGAGEEVPYLVHCRIRQVPPSWRVDCAQNEVKLDGRTLSTPTEALCGPGYDYRPSFCGRVPCPQIGKHALELTARLEVLDPLDFAHPKPTAGLPFTRDVSISAHFEVAPPGHVHGPGEDPAFAEKLHASISPRLYRLPGAQSWSRTSFQLTNLPADAAFETFLRFDGREHPLGVLLAAKGCSMEQFREQLELPSPSKDTVDVVMRSSDKPIGLTADLYDCWRGEIVYTGVPVGRRE